MKVYSEKTAKLIVELIKQKEQEKEKRMQKIINQLWHTIKTQKPDYITKRKDGCKIYEYYEYDEWDEEYILRILVGDGKILDWKRY